MINCLVFINNLNINSMNYINTLKSYIVFNTYHYILETDKIYNGKRIIPINDTNNILSDLNISLIIIIIHDKNLDKLTSLINSFNFSKKIDCYTNIDFNNKIDKINYLNIYNTCDINNICHNLSINKIEKITNESNTNESNTNENIHNVCLTTKSDNNQTEKGSCHDYLYKITDYCKIMNITKEELLKSNKEAFRYSCYRHLDCIKSLKLPFIRKNSYYEAILIEFRCLPHLEFLIRNAIYNLGEKWSHTIVCNFSNYNFINKIIKDIDRDIKIINLDDTHLKEKEYNDLLMTKTFWDLFNGEKLLIYDELSFILKFDINVFLNFDYINVPLSLEYNTNKICETNINLSLRKKSIMIECFKYEKNIIPQHELYEYMIANDLKNIPEDIFFKTIIRMHSLGKIADHIKMEKFASECVLKKIPEINSL